VALGGLEAENYHQYLAAKVRFGSKAALTALKCDFRSFPNRWGNRPAQLVDS
jgi:hypothetical protein